MSLRHVNCFIQGEVIGFQVKYYKFKTDLHTAPTDLVPYLETAAEAVYD